MQSDIELKAPWEEFPDYPRGSLGWRMGPGEDHVDDWRRFYSELTPEERAAYQCRHPAQGEWIGFYNQVQIIKPVETK